MSANSCLLLKSNSITMYSTDVGEGKTTTFSEGALKHLEIKDEQKFRKEVEDFLDDLKPQEALLLLAEEVTFQKNIPISDNYQQEKDEFFDKIPFVKKNVVKKELKTDKEIYFFSTNQELYKTIVEICTHKGWTIDKVIPLAIFPSVKDKSSLSSEEVEQILQSDEVLEKANLIEGEEYVVEENSSEKSDDLTDEASDSPKTSKFNTVHLLLGIIIFLLISIMAFGAYQFREGFKPKAPSDAQKIIEEAVKASPIASASATPTVPKADLVAQVLNGSGVAGQAGDIADELEELGYENVTTGNSPFDNQEATLVNYSASVSKKDRDEIKGVLELSFGDIITSEASSSAQFDITIITGTATAD